MIDLSLPAFRFTSMLRKVRLAVISAMVITAFVGGSLCTTTTNTRAYGHPGATTHPPTRPSTPASKPATKPSPPELIVFDTQPEDQVGFDEWENLIASRFPDAIVIVGHGGDIFGQWAIFPTPGDDPDTDPVFSNCPVSEEWLCRCLRAEYGVTRPIVILSCDPGHYKITDIPNCYQATDSVWITPDAFDDPTERYMRHLFEPGVVGSLDDFHCYFTGFK